jgi:16S rRNA (guanine527-N7)-methyltransferase
MEPRGRVDGGNKLLKPKPLTPEEFRTATNVSRETLDRLERYAELLRKWNRATNLVARNSLADLWRRHMLDSAQLFPLMPEPPVGRPRVVVDLGSGAGFPGLVLAILGAGEVHLVEADGKKTEFLREVARVTETSVTLHHERIERLGPFPADLVTARACTPMPNLLHFAAPFLRPRSDTAAGGVGLFPQGRNLDQELTNLCKMWRIEVEMIPSCTDRTAKILRLRPLGLGSAQP